MTPRFSFSEVLVAARATRAVSMLEKNPTTLMHPSIGVDEAHAQEVTAYLRPKPTFNLSADGTKIAPDNGVWQPHEGASVVPTVSYLHEREHKRELRLQSAQQSTRIAASP